MQLLPPWPRRLRVPVYLLAAAHLLAPPLLWATAVDSRFTAAAVSSVIFSQACLVGVYAALGTSFWPLRLVAVMSWLTYTLATAPIVWPMPLPAAVPGSLMALVTVALGLFRRGGLRMRAMHRVPPGVPLGRPQFSLRDTLILMVIVGVIASVVRKEALPGSFVGFYSLLTAVTLAAVWAALGHKRPVARSLSLAAGAAMIYLTLHLATGQLLLGALPAAVTALLLTSLFVLRWSGFRAVAARGR